VILVKRFILSRHIKRFILSRHIKLVHDITRYSIRYELRHTTYRNMQHCAYTPSPSFPSSPYPSVPSPFSPSPSFPSSGSLWASGFARGNRTKKRNKTRKLSYTQIRTSKTVFPVFLTFKLGFLLYIQIRLCFQRGVGNRTAWVYWNDDVTGEPHA